MNGNSDPDKIILGTVQFGLPYGISNTQGQVSRQQGAGILALARQAGIRTLDTAIAYGDSETTLGILNVADWQIITKLPEMPALPGADHVAAWVEAQVKGSLTRLRVPVLHGLLLHRPAQLRTAEGAALYRALRTQCDLGHVRKIGISIYDPEELAQLPSEMTFDIVQAPLNVLDTRIVRSGWAARLAETGCELHARSIFLQGLLLMSASARPAYFSRWDVIWRRWENWLVETDLSPLQLCVRHALRTADVKRVVIGVDSTAHLEGILSAAQGVLPARPASLDTDDPALLNPALWNRT
ncbi:aldo/keto reductase [Pseudothauera nasutitermitis]|uniref:Aldo/keto reductase n=1 Tax=Pseudothauera nasutitermitis TaxID=2565930 RepID=A0A4S4ATD3_9RHOO|nr:aldo/keto reductase [Pseudothauera nasutitermitis]THF63124.1 aldo/keto reductase [Pseudothauera nasutitermitis]